MNNKSSILLPRRRVIAAAVAVAALGAVGAGLSIGVFSGKAEANAPAAPPPAVPVSVAAVVAQKVAAWDEFSGRLEAVERVEIRPRVAGTVQAVHFREGALVKAGDLLVTLDPAPYAAEVDRAEAQVVAAQARVAYTRSELDRARRLWDERAIAQREFDERTNAAREAEANLRAAQASLQSARLNLGYTQIRAPIAGRTGKLQVTTGNLVAAGASAPVLVTLVSVNPMYASFDADEKIVARALRDLPGGATARGQLEGIPVEMSLDDDAAPIEGRLQLVDNQVDTKSGTVRVRAVFENREGRLIPGQFAKLRMGKAKAEPAILVNERAIGTDQSKRFVMVVDAQNKAVYREVSLGAHVNGLRIITEGLKGDERVVVNGLQRVRPGTIVAPQVVPMDAKPEVTARGAGAAQS